MTSRQNKARSKKKTTADAAVFVVMRRAQQCRARTQSAAVLPSLAPHDSKARLRVVTTRRRFMAKPRTPHPIPQAAQLFKCRSANVRGRGARPLVLSLGGLRGILSFEKESIPLYPCSATGAAIPTALCAERKKEGRAFAQPSSYAGLAAAAVIAATAIVAAAATAAAAAGEDQDDEDQDPQAAAAAKTTVIIAHKTNPL